MQYYLANVIVFLCGWWSIISVIPLTSSLAIKNDNEKININISSFIKTDVSNGSETIEKINFSPNERTNQSFNSSQEIQETLQSWLLHNSSDRISKKIDTSSVGWQPILDPDSIWRKPRQKGLPLESTTEISTTAKIQIKDKKLQETPFRSSPQLSSSGWIPITNPKNQSDRQARMRFKEFDYDDIITAPPHTESDTFEVVVGASLHKKPNTDVFMSSNKTSKSLSRFTDRFRRGLPLFPLSSEHELSFPTIRTRRLELYIPHQDSYDSSKIQWTSTELKTAKSDRMFSNFKPERLIINHPVGNFQRARMPARQYQQKMPLQETRESIIYIPLSDFIIETATENSKAQNRKQESVNTVKMPLWEDSAIDRLFTLPPLDFRYNYNAEKEGELSLEKLFSSVTKINKNVSESVLTTSESAANLPIVQEGLILQAVMNAPPEQVIINTASGPHSMFAYSTVHGANSRTYSRKEFKPKLETKPFISEEEEYLLPKAEERNNTIVSERSPISTESLAYILIGTCLGLSFLCLLAVLVTMKCRKSRMDEKSISTESRDSELINGWVSNSYSKDTRFAFETDLLRPHDESNPVIDPWFCKKPGFYENRLILNVRHPQLLRNGMITSGIRFDTLSIGPCKQIKRTTVIPADNKALVTDGHTAVMRELSSDSSTTQSSCPSDCSSYRCPAYQPLENEGMSESLDIQEDLFDQKTSNSEKVADKVAEKATAALQQLISNQPNSNSSPTEEEEEEEDKNSIIHWSSNDERLI